MRPSLTNLQQDEQYLQGRMMQDDAALYEAGVLTDPERKTNLHFLQKTFALLRLYNRKRLKQEAAEVHDKLFADPKMAAYQQNIYRLFKQ